MNCRPCRRCLFREGKPGGRLFSANGYFSRTAPHQMVIVAAALALVGGLYVLPKGIMKPKESKSELSKDAARTANRDGGGMATNGSKTEASSGAVPATATTRHTAPTRPRTPPPPLPNGRNSRGCWRNTRPRPTPQQSHGGYAPWPASYENVQRFDSAGYSLRAGGKGLQPGCSSHATSC